MIDWKKSHSLLTIIALIMSIVSCSEKSKNSSDDGGQRGNQNQDPAPIVVCLDGVIKEVLGDARTALVQSTKLRTESYLWNYISGTVKKDIVPIFETDILNDAGNLVLRSFDNVRYQIQETNSTNGTFRDVRLFRRGSDPVVKFSQSGDYLISVRRRGSSVRNRVDVLDIFRRDIIWDASFGRIVSAELKDRTRGAIVTVNQGAFQLNIFNPSIRRIERGVKLEGRGFGGLSLSENLVQVKLRDYLLSFDGDTGELRTRIRLNQIIDVDKNSDHALISVEPFKYQVVSLVDGMKIYDVSLSSKDRLDTCQLNFQEGIVACADPTRVSSMNIYDLEAGTSRSTCLANNL